MELPPPPAPGEVLPWDLFRGGGLPYDIISPGRSSAMGFFRGPPFNRHISYPVNILIKSAKSQVNRLETEKVIPENV